MEKKNVNFAKWTWSMSKQPLLIPFKIFLYLLFQQFILCLRSPKDLIQYQLIKEFSGPGRKSPCIQFCLCTILFDPYVIDIILTYIIFACQFFHVLISPARQKDPWDHQGLQIFQKVSSKSPITIIMGQQFQNLIHYHF